MTNENMNAIEEQAMNLTEDSVVDTEATYGLGEEPNVGEESIGATIVKTIIKLGVTYAGIKVVERGVKKLFGAIKGGIEARREAKAQAKAENEEFAELHAEVESVDVE